MSEGLFVKYAVMMNPSHTEHGTMVPLLHQFRLGNRLENPITLTFEFRVTAHDVSPKFLREANSYTVTRANDQHLRLISAAGR